MMGKKDRILFRLIIHTAQADGETEYTIFDKNPSFSSLSVMEKQRFIKIQQQKIKKLITQKYQPGFQKSVSFSDWPFFIIDLFIKTLFSLNWRRKEL